MSVTYDPGERRETPLLDTLRRRIRKYGPISLRDYMDACLLDPEHGYYRTRRVFGPAGDLARIEGGDFVTAPEISQIFGELIGLWCAVVWRQMGAPGSFNLVELGPGRGTMMRDALRALRVMPEFLAAARVHLIECSETLIVLQRQTLQETTAPKQWHDRLASVSPGPTIVVANEFLDAWPVDQFVKTAAGWTMRAVGLDQNLALQFTLLPMPAFSDGDRVARRLEQAWPKAEPGGIVQHMTAAPLIDDLGKAAAHGPLAALFIDYGHTRTAPGDTLQAVRRHRTEHPLCSPGEADLSSQVDFQRFANLVARAGAAGAPVLAIDGPVTQAELLGSLGIAERASRLMAANPARANEIETGFHRLMAPAAMGTRFKAIGGRSVNLPLLPGFPPPLAGPAHARILTGGT